MNYVYEVWNESQLRDGKLPYLVFLIWLRKLSQIQVVLEKFSMLIWYFSLLTKTQQKLIFYYSQAEMRSTWTLQEV